MRKRIFLALMAVYVVFWAVVVWRAQVQYGEEGAVWFMLIGLGFVLLYWRGSRYIRGILFGVRPQFSAPAKATPKPTPNPPRP